MILLVETQINFICSASVVVLISEMAALPPKIQASQGEPKRDRMITLTLAEKADKIDHCGMYIELYKYQVARLVPYTRLT